MSPPTQRTLHGRPGIVLHRVRRLAPELRTTVDGLPVTTVERVLLDLAGAKDLMPLRRAWEGAQRERLLDVSKVVELVENSPGRRVKPLKALIEEALDAPDTIEEMEARFADFLRERPDLPPAAHNVVIEGYIVDVHFPGTGLIIELDSERWHWNRREQDSERDADLHLAGYVVYRVTWKALTRHTGAGRAQDPRLPGDHPPLVRAPHPLVPVARSRVLGSSAASPATDRAAAPGTPRPADRPSTAGSSPGRTPAAAPRRGRAARRARSRREPMDARQSACTVSCLGDQ